MGVADICHTVHRASTGIKDTRAGGYLQSNGTEKSLKFRRRVQLIEMTANILLAIPMRSWRVFFCISCTLR